MNFRKREIFCFAAVFGVLISVYLYTIAPTASLWDCGEFIACSHILGVPHPPGTPFYILLGRVFDILIPFKEVAKRMNFLSALSGALAGAVLYLVILKVLSRFRNNRGKKHLLGMHLIALFSSIGAGLCFSVWVSSVEAEVYDLSTLIIMLGLWLVLQWDEHRQEKGDNNYLLLLAYILFLSIGVHLIPLLIIPGILVFLILFDERLMRKILISFIILFTINSFAIDPPASTARGIFLAFGVGPRLPVSDLSNSTDLGYGFNVEVSYTDNGYLPFFLFASFGFEQYPGSQSFYQETDYSNLSTNAIPVNPINSQLLLPDATALRATTNLFIFLPPRKNSFKPLEENRVLSKPIINI